MKNHASGCASWPQPKPFCVRYGHGRERSGKEERSEGRMELLNHELSSRAAGGRADRSINRSADQPPNPHA
jgi:hypothetical protein|eukprot:COSAG06_NODE_1886_length_8141_cov_76.884709_7_plen_71_part_00